MEKEHITWRKSTPQEVANGSPEMVEISRTIIEVDNLALDWAGLRLSLMQSAAFNRILQNPAIVNPVAYGALQTILSTESNEQHLLQMLQLTMNFTNGEKSEINTIFESNNFTIRL